MIISIIAAVAKNGVIGKNNEIPWHLPADFKYFSDITKGHSVVMGQKTYESILAKLGQPLPGRANIILSKENGYQAPSCKVFSSWDEALKSCENEEEIFIIGGAQIYALAMPFARRLYLTIVDTECAGDTHFPKYDPANWHIIKSEPHKKDKKNNFNYSFNVYERKF